MKREFLQMRLEPELALLVKDAVKRTGLSKSEVLRKALHKGLPKVVSAFGTSPRRALIHELLEMKGLEIPVRHHPMKRKPK